MQQQHDIDIASQPTKLKPKSFVCFVCHERYATRIDWKKHLLTYEFRKNPKDDIHDVNGNLKSIEQITQYNDSDEADHSNAKIDLDMDQEMLPDPMIAPLIPSCAPSQIDAPTSISIEFINWARSIQPISISQTNSMIESKVSTHLNHSIEVQEKSENVHTETELIAQNSIQNKRIEQNQLPNHSVGIAQIHSIAATTNEQQITNGNENRWICDQCQQNFDYESYLERHLRVHRWVDSQTLNIDEDENELDHFEVTHALTTHTDDVEAAMQEWDALEAADARKENHKKMSFNVIFQTDLVSVIHSNGSDDESLSTSMTSNEAKTNVYYSQKL